MTDPARYRVPAERHRVELPVSRLEALRTALRDLTHGATGFPDAQG